ncbi:class I SAM-dependent methyltransferase [Goodfellowiella coeruleoviolacea]|uniref:Methyltransferase domain-containing protein n=1 Tax=Goodfellowiella coeruleoviolacea TaxID=334858 RepID=A0AAE3GM31_9PSEU|nr:class I SAM-dependent methyltransferase [Goodfellowiella coeruleoviolacea]MCP2169992.1 Methyltransferase domain-containing protein [Goodfellowiella coeruleoviolacea]
MPFNHNDFYHRLLLRQLPADAAKALDVGCGLGGFARRLAQRGVSVDAVDPSGDTLELARTRIGAGTDRIRWIHADITAMRLPAGRYDFISCLASLHHVPFDTVTALRQALAPGGVLAVLGCYRQSWPGDAPVELAAVPANAVVRVGVAAWERTGAVLGRPTVLHDRMSAPATAPAMTLREIRAQAVDLLPGATVRRLLFWRYLLVYRRTDTTS